MPSSRQIGLLFLIFGLSLLASMTNTRLEPKTTQHTALPMTSDATISAPAFATLTASELEELGPERVYYTLPWPYPTPPESATPR